MNSETVLAIWNVFIVVLILYAPGIGCGVVALALFINKKWKLGLITSIVTLLLLITSSVVLYYAVDFMMSW